MDKIKNIISPGHKDDDELLYGSGEKGIHQRGYNSGSLSGQGSHLHGANESAVEKASPLDAAGSAPMAATTTEPTALSEKPADTGLVGAAVTTDSKDTAPLQTTTAPISSTSAGPAAAATTTDGKPHYGRDAGVAAGALGGAGSIGIAASELSSNKADETQTPTQVEPATTSAFNPTDKSSVASIKSGVPGNPPPSTSAATAAPTQGEGVLIESTTYTARSYPLGIPSNQTESTEPLSASNDSSALTGATATTTSQPTTTEKGGLHSGPAVGNVGTTSETAPGTLSSTDQNHARNAALLGAGAAASGGLYEATKKSEDDTGPASKTLGPHSSNVANILDPRVTPDVEKSMSEEKQQERAEQKEAEQQGEAPERKSSTGGMLKGLLAKFGGGRSSDSPKEEETTQKGEGSHLARDAAVAGGTGAAGAGAYEAVEHHESKQAAPTNVDSTQQSTPYSSHGVDPRVDGGAAAAAATTAATTSGTTAPITAQPVSAQQPPVTTTTNTTAAPVVAGSETQHHTGRDAALAGGAGAAGLGTYEAVKHHEARDTATEPVVSQPRTATMPTEVAPTTATHTQPQEFRTTDNSHRGAEAAVAGVGAAGIAEHEHEKHRQEQEAEKLRKEQEAEAEKQRKEQEKAMEKQRKEYEKEIAAAEKAHEKELKQAEKEEKKHEKEIEKAHKKEEKEHQKAEKEAEKAQAAEEKHRQKELEAQEKARKEEEHKHEKEAAAAAAAAGAAEMEHRKHEKQEERTAGTALPTEDTRDDKDVMKNLRHNHTESLKEYKEHEKERKAAEEGDHKGGLLGSLLHRGDKKSDEGTKDDHHHGKEAAGAGGLAAAGAYGVHEHDKHERSEAAAAAPATAPGEVEPTAAPTTAAAGTSAPATVPGEVEPTAAPMGGVAEPTATPVGGAATTSTYDRAAPATTSTYDRAAPATTSTYDRAAPATALGETEPTAAPITTSSRAEETHHGRDAALVGGGAAAAGAYGLHEHDKNRAVGATEPMSSHTAPETFTQSSHPVDTKDEDHHKEKKGGLLGGLLHKDKSDKDVAREEKRHEQGEASFPPQYDAEKHHKQHVEHERIEEEREKKPSLLDKILHRHKDNEDSATATTTAESGDHHNKLHKDPPPGHPATLKAGEFAEHHDTLPTRVGTDGPIGATTHGRHDSAALDPMSPKTTEPAGERLASTQEEIS